MMLKRNQIGVILALTATVVGAARFALGDSRDVNILARNIYDGALANPPADATVAAYLATLQPDGSFSDVNYADTSTANWQAPKHLNRLNEIAIAYNTSTSTYYHSTQVQAAITSVYNHWLTEDYQNSNWFYNQIATPQKLGQAMVIMQQGGILPTTNFNDAIAIVHRSATGQGGASQGANLASQAACTIYEGVLRYRAPGAAPSQQSAAENLIQQSYSYIGSTLAVVTDLEVDGIRVDKSFQQHQQTLYDAGYGASLLGNVSATVSWAAGTSFGISTANKRGMIDYILDGGPQWMVRGTTYDPLASGRGWTRPGTTDSASILLGPVNTALGFSGGYRTAELSTLQTRLADAKQHQTASFTLGPTGNRSYWVSDYMVQQRPRYMLSVKTVSTRTNTPESINGENLKGGYGTAGVNLVMRTGHEYDNIYPTWDWYRLPGTTSERSASGIGGAYSLLPDHHFGATAMVGGASNGIVGGSVYQMNEYGITANKSYFFFDRGEVAMGNSIRQTTANTTGGVIGTNVNQTLLSGDVFYSTSTRQFTTIGAGQTVSPTGLRWVNHDSVGYFFLNPVNNATIRTVQQTGNWDSINVVGTISTVRNDVFSLDLNHGSLPTSGSYLYAIIPNISPSEMDSYLASNPFTVLRNDHRAQAVTDNASGITEITFYDLGSITFPGGITLNQTNRFHGSSVIWDASAPGTIDFSMANVDGYATGHFTYTVNLHLSGTGAIWDSATGLTTITFSPPSGSMAGSTFTRTFAVVPEPTLPGDFDGNGTVDSADYDAWRAAFGNVVNPPASGADGNGDGIVNAADYVIWRKHVNSTPALNPSLNAAVPEPDSLLLLLVAATIPAFRVRNV